MSLPNFLIVGAPRCGTTSLHEWLKQHPDFFMSEPKEPSYFAFPEGAPRNMIPYPDQFVHDFDEYRAIFDDSRGRPVVGESSTLYLQVPEAPERIARVLGDVKIVAILRDPAERAYSHYQQHRYVCAEKVEDFRQALAELPMRREQGYTVNWDYIEPGFYARHLARYFERFGRQNVHVYFFDELKRDPRAILRDICGLVGVHDDFSFDADSAHNAAGVPRRGALPTLIQGAMTRATTLRRMVPSGLRSRVAGGIRNVILEKPKLTPEDRKYLVDIYRDDVMQLEEMLGRDLSAWLRTE